MNHKNLISVATIEGSNVHPPFIRAELPVLLKGACKSWPAFTKWTVDFFKETYGDIEVPMSNYKKNPYEPQSQKSSMKIRDYLDSALRISNGEASANEDLYSAGWFFCNGHCELLNDVTVPSCFVENWADRVQKVIHFDTRSILFGHPKVESPLHTDSFFVSTYFGMLKGQKRMRLVAPEHTAHVFNGFDVFNDEKVQELAAKNVPVYETVIEEGDIAWFPPGWWHHVKNDTFTISMTTSFVSSYHFLAFEQQIRATLIKPLLRLAQVKDEVMNGSVAKMGLDSLDHSSKVLDNASFLRNETKFVEHFQGELHKTSQLLQHLQTSSGKA